jgi:hypothetical protein
MNPSFDQYLFKLPVQVSPGLQNEIVQYTKNSGIPSAMLFNQEKRHLWKSVMIRHLDYDKIDQETKDRFKQEKRSLDFGLRNCLDLPWIWNEEVPSHLYSSVFESLKPYIKQLGRVQILLQATGQAIPLHTDLMPGQEYQECLYQPIANIHSVKNLHEKNEYLTIKIPISEKSDNPGFPTIEVDGKTYTYNTQNHVFALDECHVRHGALASGHLRGVIVMDGLFDVAKLRGDASPVDLQEITHGKMFRRVMTVRRPDRKVPFIGHDDGRLDIKSVVNDYSLMRLRSPHFLGAAFTFAEDGLSFVKYEFWRDEETYRDFFYENQAFVESMVGLYMIEQEARQIEVSRIGAPIDYADTTPLEKLALRTRMFLADYAVNSQKFYS